MFTKLQFFFQSKKKNVIKTLEEEGLVTIVKEEVKNILRFLHVTK